MDTRQYFRKLREIEATINDEFPLLVSLETADGGKAGIVTEVSRGNAAKMLVEGRAKLAGEAEIAGHRACQAAAREVAEAAELARRVHISIVESSNLAQARDKKQGPASK